MLPGDINLNDLFVFDDGIPHDWFRWMRANDPLRWQSETEGAGYWCVSRYDDAVVVSRDNVLFSSSAGGTNIFEVGDEQLVVLRALMLNMDPPGHSKYRRLVNKGFTPARVANLRSGIVDMSREIVDSIAERGECEFVDDVASQLPMMSICDMLGVPAEDRRHVYDLSNTLIGFDDPEFQVSDEDRMNASVGMFEYAQKLGDERRANPGDDLVSVLVNGEVDGEKLDDLEFNSFFLLIALAGNETTRTVTSQAMRLLIEHPDQRALLVDDPSLLSGAVEEVLRYNPAVIHFRRTATADTQLGGQAIKKGDKVVIWYPSINRDESMFDDPDTFDIRRSPNEHLAFGVGEHFCLGANLARVQLNAILGELVSRLPDMEFAGPVRRLHSNFIDGIKEMRLSFTPQGKAT